MLTVSADLLLVLINLLLPNLSEPSVLPSKYCFKPPLLFLWSVWFLHSVNVISTLLHYSQTCSSHYMFSTLNRWPCTVIQKENRKKLLNFTDVSISYVQTYTYPLLQSSSSKKLFLYPKPNTPPLGKTHTLSTF